MKCPRCDSECEQPTVDIGVGEMPVGPMACEMCHWVENISEEEQRQLDEDLNSQI